MTLFAFREIADIRSLAYKAQSIAKAIRNTESIFKAIGMGMLFVLMVIGTADVAGRYLFNSPILGTVELGRILMMGVVIFGWAHTQAAKAHVTVEFVVARFPPRAQAITDFTTLLISLILFSLIAWQAVVVGMECWEDQRVIQVIHFPVAFMHFIVSLGACLICLELIIQLFNLLPAIFKSLTAK